MWRSHDSHQQENVGLGTVAVTGCWTTIRLTPLTLQQVKLKKHVMTAHLQSVCTILLQSWSDDVCTP